MDVQRCGIHFLAAGGHKWLLSAMGCGLLFLAKPMQDRLVPDRVGWRSVRDEMDFDALRLDLKPEAACFEAGSTALGKRGIAALVVEGVSQDGRLFLLRIDDKGEAVPAISIP